MEGLAVGRIVHYVLESGNRGESRPAIVVRLWEPGGGDNGCAQLQVFTDDQNDALPGTVWRTSVTHDAAGSPGTWHWPKRE